MNENEKSKKESCRDMLVKLKGKIEDSSAKLDRKRKGSMPPCLHGFKFDHWHQNKRYRCHAS